MTEKQFINPKYYYGTDGNITDGENVYRTKNMPKEDVNEVFLDEKQLGSNSLMDCLNHLHEENEVLKIYIRHFGYKPVYHDDGHISLEGIEIKECNVRNGLLDEWII